MTEERASSRRSLWPSWRAIAIAAAAAVTGIAALIALHDSAPPPPRFTVGPVGEDAVATQVATDPLMAELLRCRSLPAGSDDAACREAWEVNRRRFMGESRTYVAPTSADAGQGH